MTKSKDYETTHQIINQVKDDVEATLTKYRLKYAKDSGASHLLIWEFCAQINTCCEEFVSNMWLTQCVCAPVKRGG